ncbi:hypothetical protein BDK51DRAFT_47385 [Blyttiomyces helicus]|uniref:F-box domain-containing protein n=1 Tax=Blyttiomyces helicus TaxID=388810 RepID=A0A4P9W1C3_9FUNG|nr:hypothetical protein BDK51DRAFT_47385 [Blyttiomyces helicus]|eukprot:RKO85979.1 hypothetical protein BDK51DRAFT_47385 [Blyttiomyces helicus]
MRSTPVPRDFAAVEEEDYGVREAALALRHGLDLAAIARGARRLRYLNITGRCRCSLQDLSFSVLLIRSLGAPLVELHVCCLYWWFGAYRLRFIFFIAGGLPNLAVLGILPPNLDFPLDALIKIRTHLRPVVFRDEDPHPFQYLPTLFLASPLIDDLTIFSVADIPDAALALLLKHPPLNSFTLGNMIDFRAPPGKLFSEALQCVLRARGSALKLLRIACPKSVDADLLACIGESTPQLEILGLEGYLGHSNRIPPAQEDVAFITSLKRGCPNLKKFGIGYSDLVRCKPLGNLQQFGADLGSGKAHSSR